MKNILVFFLLLGFWGINSCKKEKAVPPTNYTDDGLIGSWVLDSTTSIGGNVLQNQDDFTDLHGTKLFVIFSADGSIQYNYATYSGRGKFQYLEDHKIEVTTFSDVNAGYPKSIFLGEALTHLVQANRYSNINGNLKLFYSNTSGILYFSPS